MASLGNKAVLDKIKHLRSYPASCPGESIRACAWRPVPGEPGTSCCESCALGKPCLHGHIVPSSTEIQSRSQCQIIFNKEKRFSNHTADQCCHCFPCTMLPGLKRANWSPPQPQPQLQCSLVNCLRWSAVKILLGLNPISYYLVSFWFVNTN